MILALLIKIILIVVSRAHVVKAELFTIVTSFVGTLKPFLDIGGKRTNVLVHADYLVNYILFLLLERLLVQFILTYVDAFLSILVVF